MFVRVCGRPQLTHACSRLHRPRSRVLPLPLGKQSLAPGCPRTPPPRAWHCVPYPTDTQSPQAPVSLDSPAQSWSPAFSVGSALPEKPHSGNLLTLPSTRLSSPRTALCSHRPHMGPRASRGELFRAQQAHQAQVPDRHALV